MEFFAIILSLFPAGLILAVIVRLATRRRARRRYPPGVQGPPGHGRRGGPGPVREPRRPLSPAGAGSAAVALPEDDEDPGWSDEAVRIDTHPAVPQRRAG